MIVTISRKPFKGSVVQNIEDHECGGINIDKCRISSDDHSTIWTPSDGGRFPSNVILSEGVTYHLPKATQGHWANAKVTGYGDGIGSGTVEYHGVGEKDKSGGSAAKFFFIVRGGN